MDAYNITVVGGASIVGREFLKLLETRKTPVKRLRLLATARSAGKVVEFRGEKITVEETSEASFSSADDVVFLSASRFETPITRLYRAVLPFLLLQGVGLLLITYWPALSLSLPVWLAR